MRCSNKKTRGKATGMNSRYASKKRKQKIKDLTNTRLRQSERKWSREVVKAFNSDGDLPLDPHPTEGGYYAT